MTFLDRIWFVLRMLLCPLMPMFSNCYLTKCFVVQLNVN